MKQLTPKQAKLILVFAECDMRPAKAAPILGCHKNTVDYRLTRIWKNTGLDPKCFYDLCKLVKKAKKVMEGGDDHGE